MINKKIYEVKEISPGTTFGSNINKADGLNPKIFEYNAKLFCDKITEYLMGLDNDCHKYIRGKNQEWYATTIFSFDIETTSTYVKGNKVTVPYIWQIAIQDYVFYGRHFADIEEMFGLLSILFHTNKNNRIIIWVHNLAYEFQFIKKYFIWNEVFALDERSPIYCTTDNGIEFRCSLMLSGMKLEDVAKKGIKQGKVQKMVGDLDYSKIRHEKTPLTKEELMYCINDVLVVVEYITEQINEIYENILSLPYTKTGAVRNLARQATIENEDKIVADGYRNLMKKLTVSEEEYSVLKRAFAGGFTHANPNYVGKVVENVDSADISSSYPTVLCTEQFPMSKGIKIDITDGDQFIKLINSGCCLFTIKLKNVKSKYNFEHILQKDKCRCVKKGVINNGRVVSAQELFTTMTEVDFNMFVKYYDYEECYVDSVWYYKKAYLPKVLIEFILSLYVDKTKLKDIEGEELKYGLAKSNLNSCYGMIVMDIIREKLEFQEYKIRAVETDPVKQIEDYNNNPKRFLFYPWGIWVTAYARARLHSMILRTREDHIYSDTDSDKFKNGALHLKDIDELNFEMDLKISNICDTYGIDKDKFYPEDIKGRIHPLGHWDLETKKESYIRFKTLGAKRYLYETLDGGDKPNLHLTCAGVNKKKGAEFLSKHEDPFETFSIGLTIDKDSTGKMTSTYFDNDTEFDLTDYNGVTDHCVVKSYIHLESTEFHLSIIESFRRFLASIGNEKYIRRK